MPAFEYLALDRNGRRQKGIVEGDSGRQVRQALRDQGLSPLEVVATDQEKTNSLNRFSFRLGMSQLGLAMFTRQLATLIAAGLPIEEALSAVAQQTERQRVTSMIMTVRSRVLEGQSFASALADFPSTFTSMFRSTVASGEQSGHLDTILNNLATYTEQRFEARRNVEMALFYPILLLVVAFFIVGGLMVFVVPEIVRVFDNTDAELPFITSALIGLSSFVRAYFVWIALIVMAVIFGMRWLLARPDIRQGWDRRTRWAVILLQPRPRVTS